MMLHAYAEVFLYMDALNSSISVSLFSLSVSSIRSFSNPALGGKNSEKLFVSFLLQQPVETKSFEIRSLNAWEI